MQPTGNINVNEYRHQHRLRNVGAVRRVAVAALTTAMWKYHQLSHMNLDPLQNDTWKIPDNEDTTPSKPYNKIRVFYNLFVASADDEARVQAIVDEQMANLDHNLHDVNDSITMLGHMLPNVSSYMIRDHLEQGDEGETLHALWKYCKEHDNRQRKVVYLHSKGSFHPKPQNDKLRRFLTEGALSPECANLPDTCDVCSSRMSPLPHPHTPGNMWLARCDYVAKLTIGVSDTADTLRALGSFHPSVEPCDLSTDNFVWNYNGVPSVPFAKDIQPAPRFDFKKYVKNVGGCSMRPFDVLQRQIHGYQNIYNTTADEEWWGWGFFNNSYTSN
eukprot:g6212.t1 g6212   contig22:516-1826(+)